MLMFCCGLHKHTCVCVDACVVNTEGLPVFLPESSPIKQHLDWDRVVDDIPMAKAAKLVGNGMNVHLGGASLLTSILSVDWLELSKQYQNYAGAGSP
jgi:hypothetical protein